MLVLKKREELARVIGFNVNDDQSKIRRVLLDEGKSGVVELMLVMKKLEIMRIICLN